MKDTTKKLWNDAALPGLILGLVSVAYLGASSGISHIQNGILTGLLTAIIWTAKFVGCILLMKYFMGKLCKGCPGTYSSADIFHYGVIIALYSALIYSAFYFIDVKFLSPETFEEAINTAIHTTGGKLDSNTRQALDEFLPNMPQYVFFFNLVYCFLFGTVLSAILSKKIVPDNPFTDDNSDDNN